MPRFQFEISVALMVCVVGSGVVAWFVREKKGKIRLPTHTDDEHQTNGFVPEADPFNVTTPEDIVDGYPIDIDEFWKQVNAEYVL